MDATDDDAATADGAEIVEHAGCRLALDATAMSAKMVDVIRRGHYEAMEAREIPRIVQPGERIVELGAGIGFIACRAMLTGRVERLTAFEANPALVPLIRRNAALNGVGFAVENAVVQPRPAAPTVPFYVRDDFWASSLSPDRFGWRERIDVPTVDFETMLDRLRPTMLIVDIEGGEEALFRDVSLTGVKKIFVELHQNTLGRVGMKRVFDQLSARDFHYDQHHSHGGVVLFSHVLR